MRQFSMRPAWRRIHRQRLGRRRMEGIRFDVRAEKQMEMREISSGSMVLDGGGRLVLRPDGGGRLVLRPDGGGTLVLRPDGGGTLVLRRGLHCASTFITACTVWSGRHSLLAERFFIELKAHAVGVMELLRRNRIRPDSSSTIPFPILSW